MDTVAPIEITHDSGGFAKYPRPMTALVAATRFMFNIENTHHFFTATDAVDATQNERNYQRFLRTKTGARLDAENVNFAEVLSDRSYLETFPENSLASSYLQFLDRENLGLELLMQAESAGGAATVDIDPSRRNFAATSIAIHDLLHVVTGYGRDPIGEACNLAFTGENLKFNGVLFFAYALGIRTQALQPRTPVLKMISKAREMANDSIWLPEIDWRDHLGQPLDVVRARFGVSPCPLYAERVLGSVGADPIITAQAA
jgi:ubiquinone biosynthesis protein COQ4